MCAEICKEKTYFMGTSYITMAINDRSCAVSDIIITTDKDNREKKNAHVVPKLQSSKGVDFRPTLKHVVENIIE